MQNAALTYVLLLVALLTVFPPALAAILTRLAKPKASRDARQPLRSHPLRIKSPADGSSRIS